MAETITRRRRDGEAIDTVEVEPTDTPGLWVYKVRDACCCFECDEGDPDECEQPPAYSWKVITTAGVLVSGIGGDLPDALTFARDLAAVPVDWTAALPELVVAAKAPGVAEQAAHAATRLWRSRSVEPTDAAAGPAADGRYESGD